MLAQAALAQQFDWFMVDCIRIDQRMASKRLLSSEMLSCKRRRGASHPCCGCGESNPVKAKCDQKESWMRKGAQMRDGSYDVCRACYGKHVSAKCDQKEPWMRKGAQMRDGSYDVCPKCYGKHMNKHTCSCCGASKYVKANCDQKEPWMRKGAQMRTMSAKTVTQSTRTSISAAAAVKASP